MGDVGDTEREHDRDQHHEHRPGIGRAHEVRPDGSHQIAAEDAHDADHHAGINPVIQMRAPADDELGKPGIGPRFVVVEERLLGEVVGAAGAGIELRHFGVADRRGQAKQRANTMPIHMEGAVAPAVAWLAKVSHRKAPGAISAMAFIVRPVRPRVDFISTGAFSAIFILLKKSACCRRSVALVGRKVCLSPRRQ